MRAGGVGPRHRVEASAKFAVGDHVVGIVRRAGVRARPTARACTASIPRVAPLPVYLSALGMPGMTAYFGLLDIGKPQTGQHRRRLGRGRRRRRESSARSRRSRGAARSASPAARTSATTSSGELGFDAAIDYKSDDVRRRRLRTHCPDGIDVYFDNVGGDILDAALARLALHARVVICGAISQYNSTTGVKGPANYLSLLVNRASMTGMVVFDYADRYGEAAREIGCLDGGRAGCSRARTSSRASTDFPEALLMLFSGENTGQADPRGRRPMKDRGGSNRKRRPVHGMARSSAPSLQGEERHECSTRGRIVRGSRAGRLRGAGADQRPRPRNHHRHQTAT